MFLQPEKVPVKVYLSTDKDAPRLDRTPNCVQTILKACLVTGYGDKLGAGWSLPFEDDVKGIKVFRPEISPHTDFFVKVSNDTGREMTVQVLQNMTSEDDGTDSMALGSPFKYGNGYVSGQWALIASGRTFYFFNDASGAHHGDLSIDSTFLFCGDTTKNTTGERNIILHHSGGRDTTNNHLGCLEKSHHINHHYIDAKIFKIKTGVIANNSYYYFFDGRANYSQGLIVSPIGLCDDEDMQLLAGVFTPSRNSDYKNRQLIKVGMNLSEVMFLYQGTSCNANHRNDVVIRTDYWEY